jgi:hypothetical protein
MQVSTSYPNPMLQYVLLKQASHNENQISQQCNFNLDSFIICKMSDKMFNLYILEHGVILPEYVAWQECI